MYLFVGMGEVVVNIGNVGVCVCLDLVGDGVWGCDLNGNF